MNINEPIIRGSKGGCFPEYARVLTPSGYVNISTLVKGNIVLSFNYAGEVQEAEVLEVHTHEEDNVYAYAYWGGEIHATANHWVLNQYNTFAAIGTLTEDDCLIDGLGHLRPIISTRYVGSMPVYNLTVSPNHTFIADNIRVHNGGIGTIMPIVGSKGGKKGGGGRAAIEDPNTLRSKEYARVLDLVSEGEIEGLCEGHQSIYYDNVPLQNGNGTYNFKNVYFEEKVGTQDQEHISDLNAVENPYDVSTRVYYNTPVVRRVSNLNADEVYITVEVPQLTLQDKKTGDLHGSTISLTVTVKPDAENPASVFQSVPMGWQTLVDAGTFFGTQTLIRKAGYYSTTMATNTYYPTQKNGYLSGPLNTNNSGYITLNFLGYQNNITYQAAKSQSTKLPALYMYTYYREPAAASKSTLRVHWKIADKEPRTQKVGVYYRVYGSGTWVLYKTLTFKGSAHMQGINAGLGWTISSSWHPIPTYYTQTIAVEHSFARYEFAVANISTSYGTPGISSASSITYKYTDDITGKCIAPYQRGYSIRLPGIGPWDVKLTRNTTDSETTDIQNQLYWSSYTEVIKAKLRYPNSALMYTSIDAEQFSNIPTRAYEIYGIKCLVPSNYEPSTRTYSGFWDGTFVHEWTDNPAWIFYDLVTNTRYGLGDIVSSTLVDKWTLYGISQYCDQLVDNGKGSTEPRFTCNIYIQTREDAYKVVSNLASVFRSMVFWSAGQVTLSQDAPRSVDAIYTPANVIDGEFVYTSTSARTRHNVVLVSWNNPKNEYKLEVEYVEDAESIATIGINQTEVVAMGCTSQGQAHRLGKWLLYTEQNETETVTFKVGLSGIVSTPGEVIQTQDPFRAGVRLGGRIKSVSTLGNITNIELDSPIKLEPNKTYGALIALPDGSVATLNVLNPLDNTWQPTLIVADIPEEPIVGAMWAVAISDLALQSWRVISTNEVEKGIVEISAISYNASKYDNVEKDIALIDIPITQLNTVPDAIEDLTFSEHMYKVAPRVISNVVTLSWPALAGISIYEVTYKDLSNSSNTKTVTTNTNTAEIFPLNEATYEFKVVAINTLGIVSDSFTKEYTVVGKTAPPANVSGILLQGETKLIWQANSDVDIDGYEVRFHYGIDTNWGSAQPLHSGLLYTPEFDFNLVGQVTLLVKAVDTTGNYSTMPTYVISDFGDQIVNNVLETKDFKALGWPGTITNGSIAYGNISGIQPDEFYKTDNLVEFFDNDGVLFYLDNWEYLSYVSTEYIPSSVAIGSTMSITWEATGDGKMLYYLPTGASLFYSADDSSFYSVEVPAEGIVIGNRYTITTVGTTDWISIGALSNTLGEVFIATGIGTGTGLADLAFYQQMPGWIPWTGNIKVLDTSYMFKIDTSPGPTPAIYSELTISVDVPDKILSFNNLSISALGTRISAASNYFYSIQNVQLTLHGGSSAVYLEIIDKDTSLGPLIVAKNAAGTQVSATVDAIIQGY